MFNLIKIKNSFIKNGFKCEVFENRQELLKEIIKEIGKDKSIGIGGSVTLDEINLVDSLKKNGIKYNWHWESNDWNSEMMKAKNNDYYITSANAITMNGGIYIVDRFGNRISSIAFGHKKVFFVIGRNKIVSTKEEAVNRVSNISIPLNSKRIEMTSIENNKKKDFSSDDETNNMELYISSASPTQETYVYLVNEELGF
ncbi:MAG: lactate utilization protein [Peptoniphilaceae bacterium]